MAPDSLYTPDSPNGGMTALWKRVFHTLSADADMENLSMDSTCVKVHESEMAGKKRRIRRLAVPEAGGTQSSTLSQTVWETRRSSFSPLEMTTIRFTLLNC